MMQCVLLSVCSSDGILIAMGHMDDPLSIKKIRKTKARKAIITILSADKDHAFSAEELHEACDMDLHLDLSTVYRTMHTLTESGVVTKSLRDDGKAYFQLAEPQGSAHHHRIICSRCKASADIAVCPLHALEQQILSETGFFITSHSIELTGLCPDCKAEEEQQSSVHQNTAGIHKE